MVDSIGNESDVISILKAFGGVLGLALLTLLVAWLREVWRRKR